MALTPGTRLGVYEIAAPIGEGGMGQVYRATDTTLGRQVAIKILPDAFAADPERMARFEREAKTLASLNHPHIAAIYGFEKSAGAYALVMELVEGEDLSQRIARGAIPFDEALPIAKQIAEALEAAHEQGIIHRDLKPANIKVREDGTVKVLDFGLAKALEQSPGSGLQASGGLTNSPTLTSPALMTGAGMILGTAAYMSPEQARGRAADKRADIWAFGVVLFEMLTGRRAFDGDDISITLASVLKDDVRWTALPADLPVPVRRLLRRCLEKDPKRRLSAIGDARLELDEAGSTADRDAVVVGPRGHRAAWIALGLVCALWLVTLIPAWMFFRATPEDAQIQFSIKTPDPVSGPAGMTTVAVSPDGRFVVFAPPPLAGTQPMLWVRPVGAVQARPLSGTEGAGMPFWSPDSRHLGFVADRKLKKIDVTGGPPQSLCDVLAFAGGAWNREGVIVIATGVQAGSASLFRVSEAGGPPTEIAQPDRSKQETGYSWPTFLPDGRHVLYLAWSDDPGKRGVYARSIDGGVPTLVLNTESMATYAPPGRLLYGREGTLLAQAFDPKTLRVSGDPVLVASDVMFRATSLTGRAAFAVSDTGVLAFRAGSALDPMTDLAWVSRAGNVLGTVGDPADYNQLRLSPDEKRVVMARADPRTGNFGLFTLDLGSNITSQLTFEAGAVNDPLWSPDGRTVAFEATNKKRDFYQQVVGTRGATLVFESSDDPKYLDDWSPDGQFMLFHVQASRDLYALPLAGDRKPRLLAHAQVNIDSAHVSPDSKWVSYASAENSGGFETWVASFPAFDHRKQVSAHGGGQARWRADGKELFYLTPDGQMMSVAIVSDPKTGALEFKAPALLFQSPIARPTLGLDQYDVTRDGQRFLFIQPRRDQNASLASITVVVNWQAGLKK